MSELVEIGKQMVNLSAIAGMHWEGETLYVHLIGGRFMSFKGDDGRLLWKAAQMQAVDLRTGEVRR